MFSRVDYSDNDNASDWTTSTKAANTIGNVNGRTQGGQLIFVPNPLDPTENLNQQQGGPATDGQDVITANIAGLAFGGAGDDVLVALKRSELVGVIGCKMEGFGGNDDLRGNDGDDELLGGSGGDLIFGADGNDRLEDRKSTRLNSSH